MKHLFTLSERLRAKWESFATLATFAMQSLKATKRQSDTTIFAESAKVPKCHDIFANYGVKDVKVSLGQYLTNLQLISNLSLTPNRHFTRFAAVFALVFVLGVGNVWGAEATLPINYSFDDGKSSLPTGVTQSGLGSDYAAGNAPYRLKFDNNNDYIQIQVDAAAQTITIGIKEFTTSGASIQIQGSSDGSSFTNIQTLSFSQGQNKSSSKSTSNSISSSYRYFRVKRNSGGNFGLGTLAITKAAVSCDKKVTVTKSSTSNGSYTLKAGSASGTTIDNNGKVDNCDANATIVLIPSANTHYHVGEVTASNSTNISDPDASGNYTITYTKGSNISTTIGVTFEADPTYTVTWVAGSNSSFSTQTNYAGTALTDPGTPSAALYCPGGKVFVGWTATPIDGEGSAPADLFTSVSGKSIPVDGITYYAVFATETSGGSDVTDVINNSVTSSHLGSSATSSWVSVWETSAMTSGAKYKIYSMGINGASDYALQWNSSGYLYCSSAPSSGRKLKSITIKTKATKSIGIYGSTSAYSAKASATSLNTLSATTSGATYSLTSEQLANNYTCVGVNGTASSTQVVSISITYSAGTSYSNFATTCCTPLGQIKGTINLDQSGNSVTVKDWTYDQGTAAAESNIATYDVYLYSDANSYADPVDTKTCAYNEKGTGVTFTNLSYSATYKVKIGATGNTNYCDISPVELNVYGTSASTFQLACQDAELAYGTGEVVKTFGEGAFTNALTNDHNVGITYSIEASPTSCASINSTTGEVTINGAGSATITATSDIEIVSNVKYCADEASYTLTINKANISPTLSYDETALTTGEDSSEPTIDGNPGSGTVTYAVTAANPAGCVTVDENTGVVSTVAAGTATITATIAATTNYNGNTATVDLTIANAAYFTNGATVFIQAKSQSESAWDANACVKAWFHKTDKDGAAQTTYWLFDATGTDAGKKVFATVVPASGDLSYLDIQRFPTNCEGDMWNYNGGVAKSAGGTSNAVRSEGSGEGKVSWNNDALTMTLHGDPSNDDWATELAEVTDQGAGRWSGTYNNYAPANAAGESQSFKIKTNYNGWIGNTGNNDNATLDGMHVGSTYNITATLDVTDHSLTMSKEFVKGEVKFDLQGHGSAIDKLTNVTAGSKISAPSEPSATGYTFGGWFKEPACTNEWDFDNDVVNETMTLYAKWTANTYTITKTFSNVANTGLPASFVYTGHTTTDLNSTFTVDGDNFFLPNSITVTMGGSTLAAGTDYTYDNSNGAFTFDKIIDGDIVITASATAKLKSIAITTAPSTLSYLVGESFSSAGAVVTATMGDGSTKAVSATWTPAGALSAGLSQTMTATYSEADIDASVTTTVNVYSVTVKTTDPDGVEFTVAGVTAGCEVKALSQSVGSTNYKFKEWQVTAGEVSVSNNAITGTPNADVVINAKFYKPIAIEWKVGSGNASTGTTEVKYGTAMNTLTLPTDVDDDDLTSCGANKFMGWSNNALNGKVQSAPGDLFNSITATTQITSKKTFYAVFANAEGSGPGTYDKLTSSDAITNGKYLIVNEANNKAFKSSLSSDNVDADNNYINVTISSGSITSTNEIDAVAVTIDATNKTIYTAAGYYIYADDNNSNQLGKSAEATGNSVMEINNSNNFIVGGTYAKMKVYHQNNTSAYRFRFYKGTTDVTTVQLYKYNPGVTYSDYQTSCCTTLGAVSNINVVPARESATVSWNKLANASGYEYKLGDAEWATASVADAENPSISLSTLSGATSYAIQIRATGDGSTYCDKGTASAVTNFKTLSRVTAAVNDALRGTAKVSLTSGSGWADYVDAADGTTIYLQATASSEDWILGSWSDPSSGSIAAGQLTGWTDDVTVTANFAAAQLPALATPTGMNSSNVTAISATISWNAVANASSYAVVCDGATIGAVTVTDGVASCPLTILEAYTTYNWTVQAIGDNINYQSGPVCESQSFTTDKKKPTAIEITHDPKVTEYLEGESFAAAGMTVKVTYNTGEIDGAYTGYTITPNGALEYGTTAVTITASLNDVSVSTTQAITVYKKYTLTLKNNGTTIETRNFKAGDKYSDNNYGDLPTLTAGDACDGTSRTFMGWLKDATITTKQPDAPASYASKDDVMGTADVVLNAVWAKLKTPEGDPTSITTFAAGDYYLIDKKGDNYYAMSGTGTSKVNGVDVTDYVSYNSTTKQITITDESQMTAAMKYTISGTTSAAKIYNASTKAWVSTQSSGTSFSTSEGSNVVTKDDTDPRFAFSYADMGTSGNRCILYRTSQNGFCNYAATNMGTSDYASGYLWLVAPGTPAVYEDYLTTCCENWSVTASYGVGNVINANDEVAVTITGGNTYGTPTYESSDESVLTVASNGTITGVKAGSATVSIAWPGSVVGGKCAFETSVDVTVNGPITVTYNANDGSLEPETTSQNATSNTAFTLDANSFSRTGYTFQGWATIPSGDKAYNDSQADVEFAEDVTLYAVWAINSHAVTIDEPTGISIEATGATNLESVAYGTSITMTATENDGYVFTGWSVTGATVADASAKSTSFTMPDNDVTVTATYSTYTWNLVNYTVAPTPETDYTDADQFDKSAYTVTANYKRSDTEEPKDVDLETDDWTAKLNGTAIADNYEFAAGDDGKELAFYVDKTNVWSGNITVTEVDKDRFIDGLWGNATIVKKEADYTVPTLTQRPGDAGSCDNHTVFIGWVLADDAENPTDGNKVVGGTTGQTPTNKTYYAIWAEHYSGDKDFDASKTSFASGEAGSSSSVSINTDIRYSTVQNGGTNGPAVLNSGVLRLYRKNSGDKVGSYITISAASGATISEVEFEVATTNAVKYRAGAYSAGNMSDVAITDGKVTVSGLSVSQFTLANADGDHQLDISSIAVAYSKHVEEDRDYIIDCDPRYEVQFDANGGTGSYDKVTKKAGVEITLPDGSALSKDHHSFAGWYSTHYDATYSESTTMTYEVPVDGETLVAQWTEDNFGTVSFKNGETTTSTIKVYDGGTYDLAAALVEAGKEFIGWKWNGSMYTAGQANQHMTNPAEDRTYTAVWMPVIDVATADAADLSDGKWILVQNKSQLKAGDFIVIAAVDYAKALSNYQKTSNRGDAEATKNMDTLSITSTVAPLFLQYDSENDYYAFYDRAYTTDPNVAPNQKGYLYAPNALKTQSNITMQGVWAIDIADKKASIVAQGNNSDKIMRYNKGSNLFNCYGTATQQDIAIYKWAKNISSDMNVSDITNTDMVIVQDGKTLTINEPATLDNVIVEVGGNLALTDDENKKLTVNNLTIKTSLGTINAVIDETVYENKNGKSGEIVNPDKITATGEVWIEIELTQETQASAGWYAFSVPFPVDALNGVYYGNTKLQNEVGYAIMSHFGDLRAQNEYAWKKFRGIMQPGEFYVITVGNTDYKTLRFKKVAGTKIFNDGDTIVNEYNQMATEEYHSNVPGVTDADFNWNGLGNPYLEATQVGCQYLQFYDHGANVFRQRQGEDVQLMVGSAFFYQSNGSAITFTKEKNHSIALAPARAPKAIEKTIYEVRLNDENGREADNLFLTAREEAKNEYEIGRDVAKLSMGTAKCAQMWVPAYGAQLGAADFPLINNKAIYPLSINTPKEGTYFISAVENENATIYLTYNGKSIWNLSMSACEVELTKGLNEGYGLKLVVKAPQTPTGIDDVQSDKVQCTKVVLDDHVYILRGGKMYDVTGKMVK